MDIDTNLDLYPCANLCSPGDTVEILNKFDWCMLINMMDQQLVNLGFTNTVLLCLALEYSDI